MKSIIIVGSGVAGTLMARQLLQKSDHQITIFEAGPDFKKTHRKWLDYLMAEKSNPYEPYLDDPMKEHEHFGLRGSRLFVKGGTTNHWGGWSLRFKPEDFELKSRTGQGSDWPIDYNNLAPYYTKAEFMLGIEGDSDNNDPPRFGENFPFPAAEYTLNDLPMIEGLKKLGISYSHMPMARDGDRCNTNGTCYYCPINARYSASYDLMNLEDQYSSRIHFQANSPVIKILMNNKYKAIGVRYFNNKTGVSRTMNADVVVICSGTVESSKLLLASANKDWLDGIGNDSDHVGRHLIGHPLIFAEGFLSGNSDKIEQELGFITLASRHYDTPEFQKTGKMLFARVPDASNTHLEKEIMLNSSKSEINRKMASKMNFVIEGSIEQFESPGNRISLGGGITRHGLPTTKLEFNVNDITQKALHTHEQNLINVLKVTGCEEDSIHTGTIKPDGAHATSTCRMSGSDTDGVVNKNLKVHGTDNLYVCSNAVYPNVTAVNPTLTVAALAIRLADHIGT